ncbi:MAG: Gfo/Idh/MocA family oxidoreductase [Acidobacteriota bacterium]|nr:Gfo/Idh/MocA family oxidoreductase [Acidobacteriota bacterium]
MKPKDRRTFLQQTLGLGAAAAAGFSLLKPKKVVGQTATSNANILGSNERIRVGLIGCGGQGRGDLRKMLNIKNVECVALCDVDDEQSARALKAVDEQVSQRPALVTRDFRRVLELKEMDAVVIGTPDHWHALPMIMACQAGKDVYVEKPLSLTIAEGRMMVDAARKYERVVQMGTQQRSATHYADAVSYVQSGELGKIRLVRTWAYQDWMGNVPVAPDTAAPASVDYDTWLGPAPKRAFNKNRFHFNFRWYWDYAGGLMTDWGAHMIDIANWGMGIKAPSSATSVGGKFGFPDDAEETPDTQQVLWSFPSFTMIWEHATAIGRGPESRDHGVAFHGNNGVLVVDRGGWEVYPETERASAKKRKDYRYAGVPRQGTNGEDYHLLHVRNFLECMRSRKRPNSDVEIGHNSMIACHLGNIAFRLGRQVKWDVDAERIVDDSNAQKFIVGSHRAPWTLPKTV